MEKILITGGAGNVGSSLVNKLLKRKNLQVHVFDSLITGRKENLPYKNSHLFFKKCDVNIKLDLVNAWWDNHVDFVFHYA